MLVQSHILAAMYAGGGAQSTLNPPFAGWWPLNEGGSATTALDQSGNGDNGTWHGAPTGGSFYTTPGIATAYCGYFGPYTGNPNGIYIQLASPVALAGDFSLCAWIYPISTPTNLEQPFVGQDNASPSPFGVSTSFNTGKYNFVHSAGGGVILTSLASVNPGAWEHWVVTRASNGYVMYYNGNQDNTTSSAAFSFKINQFQVTATNSGQMLMNSLRIYSRALTAAEVNYLFVHKL